MKYVIKKAGEPRTDSYWATVGDAGNIDCYHVWGSREAAAEFASEADARLLARSIQRGRSDDLVLEVCLVDVAIDATPEGTRAVLERFAELADEAELWRGQKSKTPMQQEAERQYRVGLAELLKVARALLRDTEQRETNGSEART